MLYLFTLTLFEVLGYIGNASSIIGGIHAAKRRELHPIIQFVSGISAVIWSDIFLRDLVLLNTKLSLYNHLIKIFIISAFDIAVIIWMKNKSLSKTILNILYILNSISIVVSATYSYKLAISTGTSCWINIVTIFTSICGGEIIASIIRTLSVGEWRYFTKEVLNNKFYYLLAAIVSTILSCLNLLN